jgi:hypothetical protein
MTGVGKPKPSFFTEFDDSSLRYDHIFEDGNILT